MSKSYKGVYPFRIGTTSYIYPAPILPNVIKIGPFVDEIELLLFESTPDSLPTEEDIESLFRAARAEQVTYNVHLPTDICLGSSETAKRNQAVETLKHIIDLTDCLTPSTYTLHFVSDMSAYGEKDIERWQENIHHSMIDVLSLGISAQLLSIETLTYPFSWIAPIIETLGLSLCLDVGHLLKRGVDIGSFYHAHEDIVSIIHLHAKTGNDDHKPLNAFSDDEWEKVMDILNRFRGTVSLEVFGLEYLEISLESLGEKYHFD